MAPLATYFSAFLPFLRSRGKKPLSSLAGRKPVMPSLGVKKRGPAKPPPKKKPRKRKPKKASDSESDVEEPEDFIYTPRSTCKRRRKSLD